MRYMCSSLRPSFNFGNFLKRQAFSVSHGPLPSLYALNTISDERKPFVPTLHFRHLHGYSFCFADEAPSYAEQHVCGEFGHFRPWHDDNTGMEQLGKILYCTNESARQSSQCPFFTFFQINWKREKYFLSSKARPARVDLFWEFFWVCRILKIYFEISAARVIYSM